MNKQTKVTTYNAYSKGFMSSCIAQGYTDKAVLIQTMLNCGLKRNEFSVRKAA